MMRWKICDQCLKGAYTVKLSCLACRSKRAHPAARSDWPNTTSFCVSRRNSGRRLSMPERTSGNHRHLQPYSAHILWTYTLPWTKTSFSFHPYWGMEAFSTFSPVKPFTSIFYSWHQKLVERKRFFPFSIKTCGRRKRGCQQLARTVETNNILLLVHCFRFTEYDSAVSKEERHLSWHLDFWKMKSWRCLFLQGTFPSIESSHFEGDFVQRKILLKNTKNYGNLGKIFLQENMVHSKQLLREATSWYSSELLYLLETVLLRFTCW